MDETAGFEASAFHDFRAAARAALAYLHDRLDLELWMVFRLDDDLLALDEAVGASAPIADADPMVLAADLFASDRARVVPDAGGGVRDLGAYACLPIPGPSPGESGGFLCGLRWAGPSSMLSEHEELLELLAAMLGAALAAESRASDLSARAERAEEEARTDALTGVASRRSWTRIMEREEARSRRYGHPASVVSIDLDDLKQVNDTIGHAAGDELLRRSAAAIKSAMRQNDVVARLGGDEFGVLAFESDAAAAAALTERIETALKRKGIEASVGVATRDPEGTLDDTWRQADAAMYQEKRARAQAA